MCVYPYKATLEKEGQIFSEHDFSHVFIHLAAQCLELDVIGRFTSRITRAVVPEGCILWPCQWNVLLLVLRWTMLDANHFAMDVPLDSHGKVFTWHVGNLN